MSQRLTYRCESSEPHIKFSRVGIQHWEKEPLEHLALKASGACAQELHRTGGNGDPILKRCTQTFMCTGPGQSKISIGIWVKPDYSSWRTSWENRGECGLLWGKDIGSKDLRSIQHCALPWRWPFWENLAPPISTEKPQAKQKSGGITAPPLNK